jgi:hypothetical protein
MTSSRYIILTILYICGFYFGHLHQNSNNTFFLLNTETFMLIIITFLFFCIFKYNENINCKKNKLSSKYILSQSLFYSIIAVFGEYLYNFFISNNCIDIINYIFIIIAKFTYIPKALFVSGFVLLVNYISYLIYPKCE